MNTVAGSVTPDVVSGYDMTLQNMTETNLVAGRLGASNCFSFYTAQQTLLRYVANPGDALPINKNPSFTLNIWVNVNASTGAVADTRVFGEQHFSGTNNNPLWVIGTSQIPGVDTFAHWLLRQQTVPTGVAPEVMVSPAAALTTNAVFDGTWHMLTVTMDTNGSYTVYVDGRRVYGPGNFTDYYGTPAVIPPKPLVQTNVTPNVPWQWDLNCTSIGGIARNVPGTSWVTGFIDDVAMWTRDLTAAEIQELYQGPNLQPVTNLLVNGSFENPPGIYPYQVFSAGSSLPGWIVVSGTVEITAGTYWQAAAGSQSLDLNGTFDDIGTIYQDLPTVPGQTYKVRFAYAGNPECGSPVIKSANVFWNGQQLAALTFDITGHSVTNLGWIYYEATVTATSTNTRLSFQATSPTFCGLTLDDVSVTPIGAPPSCAPAPSGLVSWWRAEANALDSVDGNSGTLQGGTTFLAGEVGQSFVFNGSNSFVQIPSSPSLKPTGPFTLEAWINYDQITGPNGYTIVMKGTDFVMPADWALSVSSEQRLRLQVNLNGWYSFDCNTPLNAGVWYHVALVYDGAAIKGYVNGAEDGSFSVSGTVRTSDEPMKIGSYAVLSSQSEARYFSGRIDEVALYSRALYPAELQSIYHAGSAGKCVVPTPPSIVEQPQDLAVVAGADATFYVAAAGTPPVSFQWRFNGTNIAGATDSTLLLTNVQHSQQGNYSVKVTNSPGSVVSSNALLTVLNAAPFISNVPNQRVALNSATPAIPFTIFDIETSADALQLAATSSNTNLVSTNQIVFGGAGTNRTVTITPASNQVGVSTITITVTDGDGQASSDSFTLTVDQFSALAPGLTGVQFGAVAWGDYDNDGDVDVALSGTTNGYRDGASLPIYRNGGGGSFGNAVSLPGVYLSAVAWGDYNGDGYLDLLVTGFNSSNTPTARIYRNNGDGTFTDINAGLAGVYDGAVAWGDYDNDGDLDFYYSGILTNDIGGPVGLVTNLARLYRNDGNGMFSDVGTDLPGISSGSAAWGDFDKDGRLDLLLAGRSSFSGFGSMAIANVYRNLGNGSFTNVQAGLTPSASGSAAWGDYDNDGDLDILLAGSGVSPRVYRNNGNNSFTLVATLVSVALTLPSVSWGDFDNDGNLDILVSASGSTTRIYRNNGNGTFTDTLAILPYAFYGASAWGDFDNDGDLDILLTGSIANSGTGTRLLRNNSPIANTPPVAPGNRVVTLGGTNSALFNWSAAADTQTSSNGLSYNLRVGTTPGGGQIVSPHADAATGYRRVVALGNADSSNRWTIFNLPKGTYYWSIQAIDTAFAGSPFASEATFEITNARPTISDIPNQLAAPGSTTTNIPFTIGDAETPASNLVVTARSSNTNIVALTNIVLGGVGSNRTVRITPRSNGVATITITVADAQGAFGIDSFVLNSEQFTPVSASFAPVLASAVAWGDYDNDGDLDVLLAGLSSGATAPFVTRLYRNDGNGAFTNVVFGLPGVSSGSLAWGDYNNDGNLDILITGTTNGSASGAIARIYRNNGGGVFTNTNAGLPGVYNSAAAWGDYDNDGDLDILLTGTTNGAASGAIARIYRNNGNGTFALATNVAGVLNSSVAWGDYDGDGDLDILLNGQGTSVQAVIALYRNNGNGTFTSIQTAMQPVYNGSVAWGDCDNDGDLDVLLTGYNGSYATRVYINNNGNFVNFSSGLPGVRYGSAAWGDFDNDGRLDILLTGTTNGDSSGAITRVFRNAGSFVSQGIPSFTNLPAALPPNYFGAAAWGDFDKDGDLDILLTGSTNSMLGIRAGALPQTVLIRNNNGIANTQPTAPTGHATSFSVTNTAVALSWAKSSDTQTTNANGLKYQLRVGTLPGGIQTVSPHADLSNGFRRVVRFGDAATNRWRLNLPPGNYFWSVQAIDTAFAGSAFAAEATFTVTNRPPIATNQSVTLNEDTNRVITLTGSDPEGKPITFILVDAPTNGVLTGTPPVLTYVPFTNYFGPDSFRFKVNDGEIDSAAAIVSITVNPVNDAPSFVKGPDQIVNEDAGLQIVPNWATSISPGAPNESTQTVTFKVNNTIAALFSIQPAIDSSGTLTFQSAPNAFGTARVGVFPHDDGGTPNRGRDTSPEQTFFITVLPVNDAPVADPQSLSPDEDTPIAITLTGSDVEGDTLSYTVTALPSHGTLSGTVPDLTYTPNTNYFGPDGFSFKVNDGLLDSAPALVSMEIRAVNDAPTAVIIVSPLASFPTITNLIVISQNGTNAEVVLDGSSSTDVENDPLTYSWLDDTNVIASVVTTTNLLDVGTHAITLLVSDGAATSSNSVTVEVITLSQSVGLVISLVNESNLVRQDQRPLIAALKVASASFERGDLTAGINQLRAFQKMVRAMIAPFDRALAESLIQAAQEIIDALGGP